MSGSAVTGTVLYRQRSALTPGSVVKVRLEDASRQGACRGGGRERGLTSREQVPIALPLEVDGSAPRHDRCRRERALHDDGERVIPSRAHKG